MNPRNWVSSVMLYTENDTALVCYIFEVIVCNVSVVFEKCSEVYSPQRQKQLASVTKEIKLCARTDRKKDNLNTRQTRQESEKNIKNTFTNKVFVQPLTSTKVILSQQLKKTFRIFCMTIAFHKRRIITRRYM